MSYTTNIENIFDDLYEKAEAAGFTFAQLERQFEHEAEVEIDANGVSQPHTNVFDSDLATHLNPLIEEAIDELGDYEGCVEVKVIMHGATIIRLVISMEDNELEQEPEVDTDAILEFLAR